MSAANSTSDLAKKQWHLTRILGHLCGAGFILLILAPTALGPIGHSPEFFSRNAQIQNARSINLLIFSYSNDHDGNYPDGQSSTEVFQKLLDEKYCNDPSIFYIPLSGKTPPTQGQKLKPENVSFDVTSGLNRNSSDELPVVFVTGYKVSYTPGGAAVPLIKPFPRFGWEGRPGFVEWLTGWRWRSIYYSDSGGFAVSYKSNNSKFLKLENAANSDGIIPNLISRNFKPDGGTYRQLTPSSPLP